MLFGFFGDISLDFARLGEKKEKKIITRSYEGSLQYAYGRVVRRGAQSLPKVQYYRYGENSAISQAHERAVSTRTS